MDDFPELNPQNAVQELDPTGMLQACGVANDVIQVPSVDKLHWAVVLENGSYALLPSAISTGVERVVAQHRRDRNWHGLMK